MVKLPEGYHPVRRHGVRAFALPEVRSWVEEALDDGSLHGRASGESRATHRGRGTVHVVRAGGALRAVRHYHRGGAVAPLLGDRYLRLGEPRPLRELRVSEAARGRGVPTPRVVAGAAYPAGAFYRADLVTDYVADARSLADVMFSEPGPGVRHAALEAAGRLVATMASAGLRHPDLNARNLLLTADREGFDALLLDLDRCALAPAGQAVSAGALLDRIERSLRKIAGETGRAAPSPDELRTLAGEVR